MKLRSFCMGLLFAAAISAISVTTAASAGPVPVGTVITATASSGAFYSIDDGYTTAGNPATATLSGGFGDVEFVSDDFTLFFDFLGNGSLDIYGLADIASLQVDFDFADLSGPLWSALPTQMLPGLTASILDADTLRLRFDQVAFDGSGTPVNLALEVPEPSLPALLATALCLAIVVRRRAR